MTLPRGSDSPSWADGMWTSIQRRHRRRKAARCGGSRAMPARVLLGPLMLGSWLLTAFLGHVLVLHVEIDLRGHTSNGPAFPGLVAEDHVDHDHQLSTTPWPALPPQRRQVAAAVPTLMPIAELIPSRRAAADTAAIPRARG